MLTETDIFNSDALLGRSFRGKHRAKIDPTPMLPYNLLVARTVNRKEYVENEKAMEAYWAEWNKLEQKGVWRWEELIEWDDAVNGINKIHPRNMAMKSIMETCLD